MAGALPSPSIAVPPTLLNTGRCVHFNTHDESEGPELKTFSDFLRNVRRKHDTADHSPHGVGAAPSPPLTHAHRSTMGWSQPLPDPSAAHTPGPTSSSSAPLLVAAGLPEGRCSQCVFPGSCTEARAGLPSEGRFPASRLCLHGAATPSSYRQTSHVQSQPLKLVSTIAQRDSHCLFSSLFMLLVRMSICPSIHQSITQHVPVIV